MLCNSFSALREAIILIRVSGFYSVTSEGLSFFFLTISSVCITDARADLNLSDNALPLILMTALNSNRKYLYQILQIMLY